MWREGIKLKCNIKLKELPQKCEKCGGRINKKTERCKKCGHRIIQEEEHPPYYDIVFGKSYFGF